MSWKATSATLEEALALPGDKFAYYHPCSGCGKPCSTPTLDIWQRRVKEFGGVEKMFSSYVCRDCRRAAKGAPVAKSKDEIKAPVREAPLVVPSPASEDEEPVDSPEVIVAPPSYKRPVVKWNERRPPHLNKGQIGVTVWEEGVKLYSESITLGTPEQMEKLDKMVTKK